MTISRVQYASASADTLATCTVSFTATTAGNLLLLLVSLGSDASTNATITAPSGWTLATGPATTDSGAISPCNLYLFYMVDGTGGKTSQAITSPVSDSSITVQFWEAHSTNGWPASPLDKTASSSNQTGISNPVTGTTATTAQASELWIGGLTTHYDAGGTFSAPTNGFTLEAGDNATTGGYYTPNSALLYKIASATGTAATGCTFSTTRNWGGLVATFKDNSSGGTTHDLTGSVVSSSGLAGTLTKTSTLAGSLGPSGLAGSLQRTAALVAAVVSSSGLTGALTPTKTLTGAIGPSGLSGVLTVTRPLTGSLGQSGIAGSLQVTRYLASHLTASSGVSGVLTPTKVLVAAVVSSSGVHGSLSTGGIQLIGAVGSNTGVAGQLAVTRLLSSALAANDAVLGSLTRTAGLAAALSSSAGVVGSLQRTAALLGSLLSSSGVHGKLASIIILGVATVSDSQLATGSLTDYAAQTTLTDSSLAKTTLADS